MIPLKKDARRRLGGNSGHWLKPYRIKIIIDPKAEVAEAGNAVAAAYGKNKEEAHYIADIIMTAINGNLRLGSLCQTCQDNKKEVEHTCPYQVETYDNKLTMCNCCPTCIENCCTRI